jgi:hypothetical protein
MIFIQILYLHVNITDDVTVVHWCSKISFKNIF